MATIMTTSPGSADQATVAASTGDSLSTRLRQELPWLLTATAAGVAAAAGVAVWMSNVIHIL